MVTLRQATIWARANRKYTLAFTVILLVLLALAHPGTRNYRPYSVEVSCFPRHCKVRHKQCRRLKWGVTLQVSDAISHAVDAPAEPKKAPEWRQLHDKYSKEMLPLKVQATSAMHESASGSPQLTQSTCQHSLPVAHDLHIG